MTITTSWKAVLGIFLIFVFGFLSGAALTSIFAHHMAIKFLAHPGVTVSAALEKRLTGNLHLDPTQREKIHEFFMDNLKQRQELQKQIQPEVQALNRQTFEQINASLPPDQLDQFHKNVSDLRQRFAKFAPEAGAEIYPPGNPSPSDTTPATGVGK